ncbi:hypothetical protein GWI33_021462 [Rhynchophorus ferrugineus]|uniref:Uncharacterized protein n=1 Tax=Rhynchophorus ferrugineus TaxID=354439 RepID=A0A834IVW9_RHYFE|nr:hypothetical protein GWI33_021462 [Rhynchophorus ferrugineus]
MTRITPNIKGSRSVKNTGTTVTATILYGTPIWGGILGYKFYENMPERLNRSLAISITSAYRTVFGEAERVVAGLPFTRLLVEERSKVHIKSKEVKSRAREEHTKDGPVHSLKTSESGSEIRAHSLLKLLLDTEYLANTGTG